MSLVIDPIGKVCADDAGFSIRIDPQYRSALIGLEGFSHIQVIWWFSGCDDARSRAVRTTQRPYVHGPATMGIFATRSPMRPNPVAISAAHVTFVDVENGVIGLDWIDAIDGTPVVDIKPYTPSADRVEAPTVPDWCAHWPKSIDESGDFDWGSEFNF